MFTCFNSVYSKRPSSPYWRPRPDCLYPPLSVDWNIFPKVFTQTEPARARVAIFIALLISRVRTDADGPEAGQVGIRVAAPRPLEVATPHTARKLPPSR